MLRAHRRAPADIARLGARWWKAPRASPTEGGGQFHGGLRVSEVAALRWSDVDLASGLMIIRHNYSDGEAATPKGGQAAPRWWTRWSSASARVAHHFDDHKLWCGLTHYAHPVGCAAALGAIEYYEQQRLPERADATGRALAERLSDMSRRPYASGSIRDSRGLGLMRCVEFDRPVAPLAAALPRRGAYAPYRDNLLFLCPPLCLTLEEAHQVADLLEGAVADFLG